MHPKGDFDGQHWTFVPRHGETPSIVFLTDGKANIGRAGTPGREAAEADALSAARALRAAGVATLLVDTSPRTQPPPRVSKRTGTPRFKGTVKRSSRRRCGYSISSG